MYQHIEHMPLTRILEWECLTWLMIEFGQGFSQINKEGRGTLLFLGPTPFLPHSSFLLLHLLFVLVLGLKCFRIVCKGPWTLERANTSSLKYEYPPPLNICWLRPCPYTSITIGNGIFIYWLVCYKVLL